MPVVGEQRLQDMREQAPAHQRDEATASPRAFGEDLGGGSICQGALEKLRRDDYKCPGELRELPSDYGADGMCPYKRYLPADYSEAPMLPRGAPGDVAATRPQLKHTSSLSIGDVQKQMPKPEKMKDVVRYKGPASKGGVLKQATTNAELQKAIESGDSNWAAGVLRFGLAKRCVNVNAPLWPKRERLLHLAARRNLRDVCIMLLEAGAELDPEEITDGRQPLHDACAHGAYDVVELLLGRKARVEENTFAGMRPIHWAAAAGHTDVVDLLLDRGAKIDAVSSNTMEPLHHAAGAGHEGVVRLLCKRGAKVDTETHGGQRPVQLACHGGHVKAMAVLLDFSALCALSDFGEKGPLLKWRDSPLEELVRCVERLRMQRDEAEELHDVGADREAEELFQAVVNGYRELGLIHSAELTHADAAQCGLALQPLEGHP